jgi:hypothetical protein
MNVIYREEYFLRVTSLVNISIIDYFVVLFIIEMKKFYINCKICCQNQHCNIIFLPWTKRFFKNNYLNRRKITGIVKVEPRLRCRAQISSRYREENQSWREGGGRNQRSLKNIHLWKLALKNLEYCYCNFLGHTVLSKKTANFACVGMDGNLIKWYCQKKSFYTFRQFLHDVLKLPP